MSIHEGEHIDVQVHIHDCDCEDGPHAAIVQITGSAWSFTRYMNDILDALVAFESAAYPITIQQDQSDLEQDIYLALFDDVDDNFTSAMHALRKTAEANP